MRGCRVLHGVRGDRPRCPVEGHQRLRWWRSPTMRCLVRRPGRSWASRALPPARCISIDVRIPETRMIGAGGHRLRPRRCAPSTTPGSPSRRRRSASPRGLWTTRSGTSRSASSSARHFAEFQGLQFMLADMGMKLEAARQLTYAAAAKSERGDADLHLLRRRRASASPPTWRWRSPPMPCSSSAATATPGLPG